MIMLGLAGYDFKTKTYNLRYIKQGMFPVEEGINWLMERKSFFPKRLACLLPHLHTMNKKYAYERLLKLTNEIS